MSQLVAYPDPKLSVKATNVENFDRSLQDLVYVMLCCMYENNGVGLAANQVGSDLNLFVMDHTYSQGIPQTPMVCINPVIVTQFDYLMVSEGCLSIPGLQTTVRRAKNLLLRYQDMSGRTHDEACTGIKAHIVQHECDHLNGLTYLDRIGKTKRKKLLEK